MTIEIEVTQDFINQRDERAEIYNPFGRTKERLTRDIECEIYEWYMINVTKEWTDDDRWQIDGVDARLVTYDVKFIGKYYNIGKHKIIYLLRQRDITDKFRFCEWHDRPDRLLVAGDRVSVGIIGDADYWKVIDAIQPSQFNAGYYVDAAKVVRSRNV